MSESRTVSSIKNSIVSILIQFGTLILGFVQRSLLIKTLGTEYTGIEGLFSNILSLLSLTELGVGSAIIYSMYQPMAEKNEKKLLLLMNFYSKAYNIIGCVVLILGLSLTPFLNFFIKEETNISNISLIYCLYVLNTGLSYFFIYKSSIINVAQQNRIVLINRFVFSVLQCALQIIVLLLYRDYIVYFIVAIICTLLSNFSISYIANKKFPFIKNKTKEKLSKEESSVIYKNISAMFVHKIGSVLVNSTDNLLISKFVGVVTVGLYSNYYLIISAISSVTTKIISSITASVGNLGATENKENTYIVFRRLFFINSVVAGFCSVLLYVLFNPFITIWLGEEYLFGKVTVGLIVINFYLSFMRKTVLMFKDAMGLFWNDRYKAIFESIINLVVSIVLAKKMGFNGILLGTFISTVSVPLWVEPYVLFKNGFNLSVKKYFCSFVKYTVVSVLILIVCIACTCFIEVGVIDFIVMALICMVLTIFIYYLVFKKSDECKYCMVLFKKIVSGIKR